MATFSRCLFSELFAITRGITFNKISVGSHNVQVVRTLYSSESLGLDKYIQVRQRVITQFTDMSEIFRKKMQQATEPNSKHMVFTEDLKNILHLVEPGNKNDMDLAMSMIKRYNEQHKELRFGSFVFGPVIMRMFHYLNEPTLALELLKSPELSGFFDQVSSCLLCMDLLYKNERYQDVLSVLDIIKRTQMKDAVHPKNAVVLALAACYKMNTPESFTYAMKLWKQLQEVGHNPLRRAATFAAALALNQSFPAVALEIMTQSSHVNYVTIRDIKMAAFADIGRPEDTFPILRKLLEDDGALKQSKPKVCGDVFEKIRVSVQATGNQSSIREFEALEKNLLENDNISKDQVLDDLLSAEIRSYPRQPKGSNQQITEASYSRPRQKRSSFNRPGLRDLY